MPIRGSTRLLAVLGDPIAHSLSPRMHNAAIRAVGLDAVYVALRVRADALEPLVRGLLAAGAGLNVTVPYKRAVVPWLDTSGESVRRTGACNTLHTGVAGISGENTDVEAIRSEAARLVGGRAVARALVVGTGGSARSASVAVAAEWPEAAVEVLSRDPGRAADFLTWAERAGVKAVTPGGEGVDLVVNATPLGLSAADPLPLDAAHLAAHRPVAVLDLVYVRGRTRLVRAARDAGIAAEDGRGVLVGQGAASFRHFFDVQPPREVMRAAVEDTLGR
jgi:shikimate dehydrogenase